MKLVRILAVCVGFVAVTPSAAQADVPPTSAQVDKARQHLKAGTTLYNETDFAGALIEFRRAYDTAPSFRVLFNIAQAYYQLQNYAAALSGFERYLYEGGDQVTPERRTQVEREIAELSKRVAKATITVNVPGAEVLVDDQVIGKSPLAASVRVSAGRRQIRARKTGMLSDERTVDVSGGDTLTVDLKLTAGQTIVVHEERPLLLGMGVATGALAVGAAAFGALALTSSNDWKDKRSGNVSAQEQSSAENKTRAFAVTTDVLGGLAVLAGVATVIIYFKTRSSEPGQSTPTSRVGIGPGSASFSMCF